MISIGCDIEEITEWPLEAKKRVFSIRELGECKGDIQRLAGKWCVKEAVVKALRGLGYAAYLNEIEVLTSPKGSPQASYKELQQGHKINVSTSHCDNYAMAVAIVEGTG